MIGALIGSPGGLTEALRTELEALPSSCVETSESIRWLSWTESTLDRPSSSEEVPQVAVYLASARGQKLLPNLKDLTEFLSLSQELRIPRVLIVGSSSSFEASPHHPGLVSETSPLNRRHGNPIAQAWQAFEETIRRLRPQSQDQPTPTRWVLIRSVSICPSRETPGDPNSILGQSATRRFAAVPVGFDPPVQRATLAPLARAIGQLTTTDLSENSLYHFAPTWAEPLRSALRSLGTTPIPLPSWMLSILDRLTGHQGRLDFLRYPATIRASAILEKTAHHPEPTSQTVTQDPFGQSKPYINRLGKTLLRFLHDLYWRVELRGLENVPTEGGAVLVGMHRGFQPWDGVMTLQALATRRQRYPRFLIHPTLIKFPFLAPYMMRLGGLLANQENADWVLSRGHLLGVYPEGIRGAFTLYSKAYRIRRLGRGEFVTMALRHRVPIIPFVTVGSAEIFPIWARFRWAAFSRFTLWPYFPITTPVPLPSKWHTEFLEPIVVHDLFPEGQSDDPKILARVHDLVADRMRHSMQEMLQRRPSIWWGGAFSPTSRAQRTHSEDRETTAQPDSQAEETEDG